jgi:Meckel syndrome type 1 protein
MSTNYSSCIYRSKDPVKNLKIRVVLQRATGKSFVYRPDNNNKLKSVKESKDSNDNKEEEEKYASGNDREEVVISWQSKIFSKV